MPRFRRSGRFAGLGAYDRERADPVNLVGKGERRLLWERPDPRRIAPIHGNWRPPSQTGLFRCKALHRDLERGVVC